MELSARFQHVSLLHAGAFVILTLGLLGFWLTETVAMARFLLIGLALVALVFGFSNRDRVLWSLVALYATGSALLYLLLNQLLPVWVVFPAVGLSAAVLLMFFTESTAAPERLITSAAALFVVQLFWFLLAWPFDPTSKAAVLVLFFYGVGMLLRWQKTEEPFRLRDWVGGWAWLLVILGVVLWFAEWYA